MIDKQGQKLEHQLRGQTPQRYEAHGGWHRGSSWGGGWQDQPEEEGVGTPIWSLDRQH